jgi:hypothetical protein
MKLGDALLLSSSVMQASIVGVGTADWVVDRLDWWSFAAEGNILLLFMFILLWMLWILWWGGGNGSCCDCSDDESTLFEAFSINIID